MEMTKKLFKVFKYFLIIVVLWFALLLISLVFRIGLVNNPLGYFTLFFDSGWILALSLTLFGILFVIFYFLERLRK